MHGCSSLASIEVPKVETWQPVGLGLGVVVLCVWCWDSRFRVSGFRV